MTSKNLATSAMALALSACASTKTHTVRPDDQFAKEMPSQSAEITNHAANTVGADYFTEVSFASGSAALNARSRKAIEELLSRASSSGKIKDVKVLAWSDVAYPSSQRKELSHQQRSLADARNKNVKKFVTDVNSVSVETYNMSEKPNVLQRWFNTTDEKLKNSLLAAGLQTTADNPQILSKKSHAVILVSVE